MINDLYNISFLYDNNDVNWFQFILSGDVDPVCYYNVEVNDDINDKHYAFSINHGQWKNLDFNVFKYYVKLLKFCGGEISIINECVFDIKNHNFNISLISEDVKEIRIWKYYLWLIQLKMDCKFNIVVNERFEEQGDGNDYVCISRKAYDNYLLKSETPLTDDYSSLTIIRSIFKVVDDSDIIKHPWITSNFFE